MILIAQFVLLRWIKQIRISKDAELVKSISTFNVLLLGKSTIQLALFVGVILLVQVMIKTLLESY
jgi:hypothetical protein